MNDKMFENLCLKMANAIYLAVVGAYEKMEYEKGFKGDGRHLAQRLVRKAITDLRRRRAKV